MTELADLSDEALEAEVERRRRRRESAVAENTLRKFIHASCVRYDEDTGGEVDTVVNELVYTSLGSSDYELFLSEPHKFIFSITSSYIGSR